MISLRVQPKQQSLRNSDSGRHYDIVSAFSERCEFMEYQFVYEVLSSNALYSIAATIFIVDGVVWLCKQLLIGVLKVVKLMKDIE